MAIHPNRKLIIYQLMTRLFGNKVRANKPDGTRDENGVGKFNDITPEALLGIKELGVTHIWYTGVIEHALVTDYTDYGIVPDHPDVVKGKAGSPYAIKDYYDVNPDLAVDVAKRLNEFDALVNRTHEHDLNVIIDFVPNHVARVYKSNVKPEGIVDLGEADDQEVAFTTTNNFYYLPGQSFVSPQQIASNRFVENPARATGNDQFSPSPNITDWFETVKLNYGVDVQQHRTAHFFPVPNTWEKMRDILVYWANKKVDGFRCDMVEMVPVEFWSWVIPQIKNINPAIIFIAEIYNPEVYRNYLEEGKFDFLYDKVELYDTLRLLTTGQTRATDLSKIIEKRNGVNSRMLHFLENHDEQRIASSFFAGDPWKAIPAMVVSATIDHGPVMIYFGQEVGEPGSDAEGFSTEDGRTTMFDYWGVPAHQQWMSDGKFDGSLLTEDQRKLRTAYSKLLKLVSQTKAIYGGEYDDLTQYNIDRKNFSALIHAFVRYQADEILVILSSFATQTERIRVQLPHALLERMGFSLKSGIIAYDLLESGERIVFNGENSFEFNIPSHNSYIFKIKN
jgi:glycosidase